MAQNRATGSVVPFLSQIESLDQKLNPRRDKPIWIAKFNFLGLLRVCDSFVQFRHVRNLYEGGVIGEGIVKELRPLVAKGVHDKWSTNLLLSHYRNCTLDCLISALEVNDDNTESGYRLKYPLGENVESAKFKRYRSGSEVIHLMEKGMPISVLIYGSATDWMAGVIIIIQNHWYFREIFILEDDDYIKDPFGFSYHRVFLLDLDSEICLGTLRDGLDPSLGDLQKPFWTYGLLFPDVIGDTTNFRYAIVQSGWQYLNQKYQWSEHD
jgi:hypothetical protein